jgi:hypothetical protein
MASTKKTSRNPALRNGMPQINKGAGRKKRAPQAPQMLPEKKKAGRRKSPQLAATVKNTTVISKQKKVSKLKIPTTKCPKAIARGVTIEAVVEKKQATNFPTPPGISSKQTHFLVQDDECICTAYVEVLEDEIKGANRTWVDFWATVGAMANQ